MFIVPEYLKEEINRDQQKLDEDLKELAEYLYVKRYKDKPCKK